MSLLILLCFFNVIFVDTKTFFQSIRTEISRYPDPCYCIRRAIQNIELYSCFIGLKGFYVKYKSSKAQRNKLISLEIISQISSWLEQHFINSNSKIKNYEKYVKIKEIQENIINIIEKYKKSNILKLYSKGGNGVLDHHPNLNLTYFKNVNTLEKAYWLGWLFAEGYITIHSRNSKGKPYYQFGVGCTEDDFIQIKRFARSIGFDIIKNTPRIEKYLTSKGEEHILRRITLINNRFCETLISQGFIIGKKKSKNIRLPQLFNRKLLLAFLLGYYDGDGTQGTSKIVSGSKLFLEDVLNSPFLKIQKKTTKDSSIQMDLINKRYILVRGNVITLGANLLREMIKNYSMSLPRKRLYWENYVDQRISRYRSPKET